MMRTLAASALVPAESAAPTRHESTLAGSRVAVVTLAGARGLLLITLMAAPWAFGAVQVWAWATLTVLAFVALLLWAISNAAAGTLHVFWSPLYVPGALFLALGLAQFYGHRTLDPVGTREALIKLATDLVFSFLAGQLWAGTSVKTWERLGLAIAIYAFAMALFAIIQLFSSDGLVYWTVKTRGWTFGPYVNRNHYAGLMEMLVPIAALYFLSLPPSSPRRVPVGLSVLVPITSVLLSGSLGGLIGLFLEGLILMAILYKQSASVKRKRLSMVTSLGVGVVALLFFWLAPANVSKRLESATGLTHSPELLPRDRLIVWEDTLGMIRDHPLLGVGLGGFRVAFPHYQSFATDLVWDHAHNDYVEALAETGVLGGVLILAALMVFFTAALGDLRRRLESSSGLIQLGAAIGCCGLLVHGFVDFNLHIPANAAWFVVCAALATCSASNPRVSQAPPRINNTKRVGPTHHWGIGPRSNSQAAGRLSPRAAPERRTKARNYPETRIMIGPENGGGSV